jgi:hypothetical protein
MQVPSRTFLSDGYHLEFPDDPFHPTTCFTAQPHLVRLEFFHPDGRHAVRRGAADARGRLTAHILTEAVAEAETM